MPPIEVEIEVERGGVAHAVCYWYRVTMVDPGAAALTDSAITFAAKTNEISGREDKHQNENENENENEADKTLNKIFPYTLDTGPFRLERLSKNVRKREEKYRGGMDERIVGGEMESEGGKEAEDTEKHKINMPVSTSSSYSHSPSLKSYSGLPKHYRQAATLLDEAVTVAAEDTILIEVGIDICFWVLCRVISHFS